MTEPVVYPSRAPGSSLSARGRSCVSVARIASMLTSGPRPASPALWVSLVLARFPLPCLGLGRRRCSGGQLGVSQALAGHAAGQSLESLTVAGLTSVEAERFLVQVAEQVEELDADVGSLDGPLEQRPVVSLLPSRESPAELREIASGRGLRKDHRSRRSWSMSAA
jgi:hypothetical protein